ncbi:efflux transporter outer membrane subunit [Oxalobacter paraformigenes]|uniref:NodT family efflux transporter, outer membrane factor (OMF) lipoprotein n=1 Tax=Oxalobacter paraformigenes TaxID=556268 RepID=C3X2R4_9BURK|nr:efflux transporter outer membrane subunit [Oxalobacter paraformigenes]EEO27500.1 NodT family efflux transporter, outer membrane factor (OMF) lipoprotein [Oxalobacter paraformigenes]
MKAAWIGLMGAVAAALSGCMMGPDYRRPDLPVPETYRFVPDSASQQAIDSRWWEDFGDPVLNGMVEEAIVNNRDLRAALANAEKAAAAIMMARSDLFPQISLNARTGRERLSERDAEPVIGVPNPQSAREASLGATWEIDLWGRIRRLTESAEADAKSVEQARRAALLSVVSSVVTQYINLLALDEQLKIAQNTSDNYAESLRIIELQFQYGVTSRMTVAQAASQYETAQSQIPQIRQNITQTENALNILMGKNPGPVMRGLSLNRLKPPVVPADLPSNLLLRRPDVLEAEQDLVSANAMIGATRAMYFPTISLTGAFGSSSESLKNLWKGDAKTWSFAGVVSMPVFQGGSIYSQVKQAEAEQRAALARYEGTVQSAFADVDNALSMRMRVNEQLDREIRLVNQLSDYSRLAKLQYDEGYSAYSVVLQADQSLFPRQLTLAQLKASSLTSVVNVYKSLGGGWVDLADSKTPQRQETE